MGKLIPINTMEVLPGDVINQNSDVMIKFSPLISPVMHDVNVKLYSFYVPYRILWENFERFMAGNKDGSDTGLLTPSIYAKDGVSNLPFNIGTADSFLGLGTITDHMGIAPFTRPVANAADMPNFEFNGLFHRGYYKVWHEYFANLNVSQGDFEPQTSDMISTAEATNILITRTINWEKDYFTASLPWPQRGPTVLIPGTGTHSLSIQGDGTPPLFTGGLYTGDNANVYTGGNSGQVGLYQRGDSSNTPLNFTTNRTGLQIVGDAEGDGTLDNLRTAMKVKMWLETAARSGSRYKEHLLGHWGTDNRDSRLDRPEFLAGSQTPVVFSDVMQTSSTDSVSPQGNYSGHGMTISLNHKYKRKFTEDGMIITLMAVCPKTAYCDGIPKMFLRRERFDYPFPEFAHLSEQPIQNQEIYAPYLNNATEPEATFGYIPRYSEMRYNPSRISGDFRTTLNHWHLGRQFYDYQANDGTQPGLNNRFVMCEPSDRIFAVTDGSDSLYCQVRHNIFGRRGLPKFAVPNWR